MLPKLRYCSALSQGVSTQELDEDHSDSLTETRKVSKQNTRAVCSIDINT